LDYSCVFKFFEVFVGSCIVEAGSSSDLGYVEFDGVGE